MCLGTAAVERFLDCGVLKHTLRGYAAAYAAKSRMWGRAGVLVEQRSPSPCPLPGVPGRGKEGAGVSGRGNRRGAVLGGDGVLRHTLRDCRRVSQGVLGDSSSRTVLDCGVLKHTLRDFCLRQQPDLRLRSGVPGQENTEAQGGEGGKDRTDSGRAERGRVASRRRGQVPGGEEVGGVEEELSGDCVGALVDGFRKLAASQFIRSKTSCVPVYPRVDSLGRDLVSGGLSGL